MWSWAALLPLCGWKLAARWPLLTTAWWDQPDETETYLVLLGIMSQTLQGRRELVSFIVVKFNITWMNLPNKKKITGKPSEGQSCKFQAQARHNNVREGYDYLIFSWPCSFIWSCASSSWVSRVRLLSWTPVSAVAFCFNRAALSCLLYLTAHKHFCFYKQLPVNMTHTVSPGWSQDNKRHTLCLS